jgi:type III pantothenate kinase
MTTLCLDFGNSRMKAAIFEDEKFRLSVELPDDSSVHLKDLLKKHQPDRSILSSVIRHNPELDTILSENTLFHRLSHQTKLNFTTPVGKPETIGADRLALAAAAVRNFPAKNNLVIGMGSCITYNFINQDSEFLGGAISPGMEMRFRSMHEHTASLPLVRKDWNFPVIGYDTKTNLQAGVIAGITYEMGGFIEYYASRYRNFNAVLTGGDSAYFAGQLKYKIFADFYFLFKGLYALSETNHS